MSFSHAYSTGRKLSLFIFLLSFALPLQVGGEYIAGFTIYPLLAKSAPGMLSEPAGTLRFLSYLSSLIFFIVIIVSLKVHMFGRVTRAAIFAVFLLAIGAAVMANAQSRLLPSGPAAAAIIDSYLIAAAVYLWSLFDADWK